MKKFFAIAVCAVLTFAASAQAMDAKIVNQIPERYALLVISNVDPDAPLDKEKILEFATEQFTKLDVEQMQYALYDKGKKQGDGPRAFGEFRKEKSDIVKFKELAGDNAKQASKFVENIFGYEMPAKDLHAIYSDNEVVADDDFKGKPVIMRVTVPQVSKDAFGKPYIKVPVDKHGFFGLHIYISRDDPFLRKIKKGSEIIVRAYPKGLMMQDVILDGVIFKSDKHVLIDGKAVDREANKKK